MRRIQRRIALVAVALLLPACDISPPGGASTQPATERAERPSFLLPAPPHTEELTRSGAEPAPARFGLGRAATHEEIARIDIDVMADGKGLPPGLGTAAEGEPIYRARCAACHGEDGTTMVPGGGFRLAAEAEPQTFVGGDAEDAFTRRTVGNYWPYAPTLFDYVRRAMPFDRPGSLADAEVYAVVAWMLWKNELIDRDEVMDAQTLPAVEMPARDRFVPDDRPAYDRVR